MLILSVLSINLLEVGYKAKRPVKRDNVTIRHYLAQVWLTNSAGLKSACQSVHKPGQLLPCVLLRLLVSDKHLQGIFYDYNIVAGHTLSKLFVNISRNGDSVASSWRLFGQLARCSASSFSVMFRLGFPFDLNLLFVLPSFCYLSE